MKRNEITVLLKKEFQMEWRSKYAISSLLLYLVSTIYVCYLSFKTIDNVTTWNTLFWIIILFSALNAVSRSFSTESRSKLFYLYSLVSPQAMILSKLAYSFVMMLFLSLATLLFYAILIGNQPLEGSNVSLYVVSLVLGSMGFAGILTLLAAIAAKTNNNLAMMSILGFPLILPLLITLNSVCTIALRGLPWEFATTDIIVLSGINVVVPVLSYILFPYLWRE